MPSRLVYAPNCYCFTKNAAGDILNVSDYVVRGQVQRLINQASNASVTLRNPMKRFTTPSQGVAFHPMDPITIFLERLQGFPVQVFTGYLDDTPYYQMYPGTITLQATCTLKKIIYTYWDPSLPFVSAWLYKWGWLNDGSGKLTNLPSIANPNTVASGQTQPTTSASGATISPTGVAGAAGTTATGTAAAGTTPASKGTPQLQDGSIGKLLWAVLTDVAQWTDTNIWIEELPSGVDGIAARMAQLLSKLTQDDTQAATEYEAFMQKILGSGAVGITVPSGGGSTAGGAATGAAGSGQQWRVTASQESLGGSGCAGAIQGSGYSELSTNPGAGASGCDFAALGKLPCGTVLNITNPANGKTVKAAKQDNGCGSSFMPVMGLYPDTAAALGLSGGQYTVQISRADGGSLTPAHGTQVSSGTPSTSGTGNATPTSSNPATAGATASAAAGASGSNPATSGASGATTGTTLPGTGTGLPAGQTTRINAMLSVADSIASQHMPYVWGGGHGSAGTPSGGGYDCSGCVAAVLAGAGLWPKGSGVPADNDVIAQLQSKGLISPGPGSGSPEVTLFDNPGTHIYMSINGRGFGTSGGSSGGSGGGWLPYNTAMSGFNAFHFDPGTLNQAVTAPATGTGSGGAAGAGGGGTTVATLNLGPVAFGAQMTWPGFQDTATAILLGNVHRGFMHDQQLLPFVQQLAQASLRSFQSMPNGDFYAFYPDYFGEMNQRAAYWFIDDIEILNGGINLSDASLVTHSYAVGDNTWPSETDPLVEMLFSTGAVDVFNAFIDPTAMSITGQKTTSFTQGTNTQTKAQAGGMADVMATNEAVAFVERYGARPLVQNYPTVRSFTFEMFLAYQNFMLAWANQFRTPFTFTFMPEVYPGGKIAFPSHGLQMYVSSVTHSWDFSEGGGFTTEAVMTAPSVLPGAASNPDLPPNMVQAMVEPVRGAKPTTSGASTPGQTAQSTSGSVKGGAGGSSTATNTTSGTGSFGPSVSQIKGSF